MTRAQTGRCGLTQDGRHRWIETTTKDSPGREFICTACKLVASEPLGNKR